MSLPSVSVCFPAFNEEATIADVLTEAYDLLATSGLDYEILVCDDCSTDRTAEIIADVSKRIPGLRVLTHRENKGIFVTFEHLYAESKKEFVFLNSTDGQWETKYVLEMLPMTSSWDVIIASRPKKPYGPVRSVVSWGFNKLPPLLFGTQTYDAGAVKLMRREIIERFPLVSRSPFAEAERLIRASRAGYRIAEYPVKVNTRKHGKASGVNSRLLRESVRDVVRVWRSLRRS